MNYTLAFLKKWGFNEIIINLHHHPQSIKEELGDGSQLGLQISYSDEPEILGTGGGIKKVEGFFPKNTFLVINCDILVDFDLNGAMDFHQKKKALATMVLRSEENKDSYGVIEIDREGRIRQFLDKIPDESGQDLKQFMFTGIHIFEPEIFQYIPADIFSSINDTYIELIRKGKRVYGYQMEGYWVDLGTKDKYETVKREIEARPPTFISQELTRNPAG
ncbi:MAG: nucleotidyltransferase family protein [Deltaproteobacteria bacterium]|nr:MAG: nucleotidyltransferase family protein [Deltaproteobacteria bacterium]